MRTKLSAVGTGDSLFTAPFPEEYTSLMKPVSDFIKSCDVRMTNLETNLSDFNLYAGAYSGGTWLNTRPSSFPDLLRYGFNFFGNANNHVMDYSYGGLLSTLDVLDQYHVLHAGTGRTLEEASRPAVMTVNGQKIAIFTVDASMNDASRAGRATKIFPGRPGVNFLRHSTTYTVTEKEMEELRSIAKNTRINFSHQMYIDTGYLLPDPPGTLVMGDITFTTNPGVPKTRCNARDLKRITDDIRKMKEDGYIVFMLIHCHGNDDISHFNPPAYLIEFDHACIDAGCSAIFGGGCHSLRGIEIYKNAPVFYSLGDFIYQGLTVEHLPADFMEKYDMDIYASAQEALFKRSRGNKVGLHCQKENYLTVLPRIEIEDGRLSSLVMLPISLNFDRKDTMNGLPYAAKGKEAEEIFELIRNLSEPFGTKLILKDDVIRTIL